MLRNTNLIFSKILLVTKYKNYICMYLLLNIFCCNRLFVDKIRDHPQYDSVSAKDKAMNRDALRIVIPKAEKLKKQLLDQYQAEFDKYLEDLKERERIEKERLRQEELQRYLIILYIYKSMKLLICY